MAKSKKVRVFENYDQAMSKVDELASRGDRESDDYIAAVEAASQFFLREWSASRFNKSYIPKLFVWKRESEFKWLTVNELCKIMDDEIAGNG